MGVGLSALDGDGDVGVAAWGPGGVLQLLDACRELRHGHAGVWHPFVAVSEHTADDAFAGAADEDRWVRSLRGLGPGPDGFEVDVAAVELGLVLGPDRADRLYALIHDRPACRRVDAVVGDLFGDPAHADTEQHAPVREGVEAGERLRG